MTMIYDENGGGKDEGQTPCARSRQAMEHALSFNVHALHLSASTSYDNAAVDATFHRTAKEPSFCGRDLLHNKDVQEDWKPSCDCTLLGM